MPCSTKGRKSKQSAAARAKPERRRGEPGGGGRRSDSCNFRSLPLIAAWEAHTLSRAAGSSGVFFHASEPFRRLLDFLNGAHGRISPPSNAADLFTGSPEVFLPPSRVRSLVCGSRMCSSVFPRRLLPQKPDCLKDEAFTAATFPPVTFQRIESSMRRFDKLKKTFPFLAHFHVYRVSSVPILAERLDHFCDINSRV